MKQMKEWSMWLLIVLMIPVSLMGCGSQSSNKDNKEEGNDNKETEVVKAKDEKKVEDSDHLMFKGIPIDGTLKEFVKRMKSKGFKSLSSEGGIEVMQGDFAASKDCKIFVSTLDNKDLVSWVLVVFPEQDTWEGLYGDYNNLKEWLSEKYGQPSVITEKVEDDYSVYEQDHLFALKMDKCKYETCFNTEKGDIILRIGHDAFISCFVLLCYKDKINGSVIKDLAKDDL